MKPRLIFYFCFFSLTFISCGTSTPSIIDEYSDTLKSANHTKEPKPTIKENAELKNDGYETLNKWLTKYTSEKNILDKLGVPEHKGEDVFWEGSANYVQKWEYRKLGLTLQMESDEYAKDKRAFQIEIVSPSPFKTSKGIGIGTTKEMVLESYSNEINNGESEPDAIVVGSIYGGTVFFLTDGKVCRIFIGELAE